MKPTQVRKLRIDAQEGGSRKPLARSGHAHLSRLGRCRFGASVAITDVVSRGHSVDILDTSAQDPFEQIDAAKEADLVYIAESLLSDTTTDGLEGFIKDVETPIIFAEAFTYDDFALTGDVGGVDWGINFNPDNAEPALREGEDSVVIADPAHPMAAGLTGTVPVYNDIYTIMRRCSSMRREPSWRMGRWPPNVASGSTSDKI